MADDSADRPDTPSDRIKITPEMIEAGVFAYVSHDEAFASREAIVQHIYRAMVAVSEIQAPRITEAA